MQLLLSCVHYPAQVVDCKEPPANFGPAYRARANGRCIELAQDSIKLIKNARHIEHLPIELVVHIERLPVVLARHIEHLPVEMVVNVERLPVELVANSAHYLTVTH